MAWGSKLISTALTITSTYQIVQKDAADLKITLNPAEGCLLVLDNTLDTSSPVEDCDVIIEKSVDGTEFESQGEAERHILSVANREGDDPVERAIWVTDCHTFRISARTRDTDDTVGGDDSTATLTIHYRLNGISA